MELKENRFSRSLITSNEEIYALYLILDILKINCIKKGNFAEEDEQYRDLFYEYKNYTIDEIIGIISQYDENYISPQIKIELMKKDKVKEYLILLAILGKIVINDVIDGEDTYRLVPKNLMDSSMTKEYCNIDLNNTERVLLISDTHIGDEENEDFEMINKLFQYAKKSYRINTAIHLGDVFHGIRIDKGKYKDYSYYSLEIQQILDDQLKKFHNKFPNDMKVIALEGNHDKSIRKYLNTMDYLGQGLNQLYLTILKPNFHMLKEREYGHIISGPNIKISLSHPLQFNVFFPYVKTNEIKKDNLFSSNFKKYNTSNIDLLLSGHFHYNMHYSITDDNQVTKRIFEVIPSLSKISLSTKDKCISKILRFIYDELGNVTHYSITPLYLSNNKIVEGEEIIYPTNKVLIQENKKAYKK